MKPRIADDEEPLPSADEVEAPPSDDSAPADDVEAPPAEDVEVLAPSPAPAPRRTVRRRVLGVVPWALAVVLAGSTLVFALAWHGVQQRERSRTEVASVATQFLQALTNFGGPTIDRDVADIRSYAIGDFASQVSQFFDSSTVAALRAANAVSTGHVQSVFVESLSGDTAEVFGVVDETLSNAKTSAHLELLRIDVEMVRTSSGWKVDRVDLLQTPSGFPSG